MRRRAAVAAMAVVLAALVSACVGDTRPPGDGRDSASPPSPASPLVPAPATAPPPTTAAPTGSGAASAARGATAFQAWCNSCHPGGQAGNGPALWPRPTPLAPAQVRARIREGNARERSRFAALPESRLDDIIAYIAERQVATGGR
jgi:mono/diheme cytochrome c family protein